ncbi:MAG: 50S ribosomal protein L22 [Candidatus Kaiserbacteria bacterium]|nr:MAG: 50S ribosomal protein L22 [Candidatus Kaiserbacteria bacterium]
MKALLTNYRQSPRKVRLVADLIRGKSIAQAKAALKYLPKKSSPAIERLLDSAVANARSRGIGPENLIVGKITVDKGTVMRRYRPFARGRAGSVRKTMSIVNLELAMAKPKAAKKANIAKPTAKKGDETK